MNGRINITSALFIILMPSLLWAKEPVDVSFSVQALAIQDRVAVQLPAKTEWSVAAEDVITGKSLIDAGSAGNASFMPGSLMKLFITAALLQQHVESPVDLATVISIAGNVSNGILHGDVIIKGTGDCLLTTRDLLSGAEKIKSLGIKQIAGDVIVDDSFFDVKGWSRRYSGPAYGMPSALGLDLHTASIAIEGQNIVVDPPNEAVKVSRNPLGKLGIRQIDDLTYEMTGAAENTAPVRSRFSIADPALYTGGTFMTMLRKQGITISGMTKRGKLPSDAREIVRVGSSDLKELIKETNRQSLNVAADNMLFLIGALKFGGPGTREKGILAVEDFLRSLGVSVKGLVIDDGSGISERNRISAEQMVEFLRLAIGKPWFKTFYESLSRPGLDGRLQEFGYRSERVRMKSGQVPSAYGLAGYADRPDGRKIAFAFIVNERGLDPLTASAAGVEVLRQLAE